MISVYLLLDLVKLCISFVLFGYLLYFCNPLHWHENHWWEWICRKSTCDFEDMGRCFANHHKSQTISSTNTEIVVALQMEQIQTKDCQMGITPMVSSHSRHYRLCSLFISISKSGYGSRPNQPHLLQGGHHGWEEKGTLPWAGFVDSLGFIFQNVLEFGTLKLYKITRR